VQFKEVIGQNPIKKQLVNLFQQNRLSHALLFLGKEGTGGMAMARAFAQYLVCEKVNGREPSAQQPVSLFDAMPESSAAAPSQTLTDSCGICPACMKAKALVHPDIHYIYPVISKKPGEKPVSAEYAKEWRIFQEKQPYGNLYDWIQFIGETYKVTGIENKQGNINAHECNEIIRKLSLKSFESIYKILVLWMPEMLSNQGNRLLKIIEEPPPDTLFILVAENDTLVLPTLLSRLQLVKLPPLRVQDIAATLELRNGVPLKKAEQIALLSEGNYHEALELLLHNDDDWEIMLRNWLNCIVKTALPTQVKWIEDISKIGREKQKQFLLYFIQVLEHAIRLRISGALENPQSAEIQATQVDFAGKLNKICDHSQQEAIIRELDQAYYQIERNANAKILFHALTIRLYHIISNNSVILMQ
jgi:DNA polymerase-3 subunit delta'